MERGVPGWAALVAAMVASALAGGALTLLVSRPAADVDDLRAEVRELRDRVDRLDRDTPAAPHPQPVAEAPTRRAPAPAVAVPVERIEDAVDDILAEREADRIEAAREGFIADQRGRIASAVAGLVETGRFGGDVAREVEGVLADEARDVWQLKEDSIAGTLAPADAKARWLEIRDETDAALVDLVGEAEARAVRAALDAL